MTSMEVDGDGASAARRRRERRLRSWWRHECQSVRMAEKVAAGERYLGLRAQTSFSAGRPGVLEEPEPQGGAVTDGYVAAPVPSLAVPLLAGAAGELVDSSSLRFLTAAALRQREEEEERKLVELEVKRKEAELQSLAAATRVMVQQRAIGSSSWTSALARSDQLRRELKELRGEKRKKRKKRKKKLPKTSSGYGRPCGHLRRVPAVPTVHSFMLPVQFLDKVLDMPYVVLRQVLRSTVPETVVVPQLQSIEGRRHSLSFVPQSRSSWSRLFSRPQSFLSCCSFQAKIFGILAGMTRRTVIVACTRLVMPVAMYLALCSFLVSSGPRCSASWPVWSRKTAAVVWQGWYCW